MSHNPYLPPTPQTPRAKASISAPNTPHVGYTVPDRSRAHTHHYAGILMQHDSSNSDSSMGYISPAHKATGTSYGTLQTEVSNNYPQANNRLVVELTSLDGSISVEETSVRKSVVWIWVVTNVVVFGFCTFTLLQPNWLSNSSTQASLGLVNYCEEGAFPNTKAEKCHYYGNGRLLLPTIQSLPWQVGTVVCAVVSAVLGVSVLLTSLCLCFTSISTINKLSLVAGLLQLTSAILLLTSLVTFPVGFDAPEVRQVCGAQSGLYNAASCHIGWSYIISCGCCALCFTLPVLSHYVTYMPKYNNLT